MGGKLHPAVLCSRSLPPCPALTSPRVALHALSQWTPSRRCLAWTPPSHSKSSCAPTPLTSSPFFFSRKPLHVQPIEWSVRFYPVPRRLSEFATLPVRGSAYAAGYDLAASADCVVPARGRALVKTDLSMAIPEGCYGRIGELRVHHPCPRPRPRRGNLRAAHTHALRHAAVRRHRFRSAPQRRAPAWRGRTLSTRARV